MGYLLVQPEVLRAKGIEYFNTIPDGRAIADFGMLKVLGTMSGIDIIGSAAELKKLIAEQTAAGITPPVVEDTAVEDVTGSETAVTDGNGFEPSVEDITDTETGESSTTETVEEQTDGESERTESMTEETEDHEQQD